MAAFDVNALLAGILPSRLKVLQRA